MMVCIIKYVMKGENAKKMKGSDVFHNNGEKYGHYVLSTLLIIYL